MKFEVGKLYKCPKHHFMIYPSKEKAAMAVTSSWGAPAVPTAEAAAAINWSDYWSKRLDCKVHYSEPSEVFMTLKQEDKFVHVLFGEKQGWFVCEVRVNIEKVLQ